MKKYFQIILAIHLTALIIGCKSYAKYTIDQHAHIKIDSGLLGTWKAVEDTDAKNFILIQSPYDGFQDIARWHNMDSSERRKYIYKEYADTTIARNVYEGDRNMGNPKYYEAYYKFLAKKNREYYITYFDHHGINPHYQQWTAFLSSVKKKSFLNIVYRYVPYVNGHFITNEEIEGYFFVRLININTTQDTITTAVVADTTLKNLTSAKEVRKRIAKNGGSPAFYSDTLHFYKINGYHSSLKEAVLRAN